MKRCFLPLQAILFAIILSITSAYGQIPKPEDVLGFKVGDDYKLADHSQMLAYWEKLDQSTDRVRMIEIGKSVVGRPIKLLFISSEENMRDLEKWRTISESLARAEIDEQTARDYASQGKAIVWFDGGMHATERAHAQMTNELMYKIASEESEEMQKIRQNVVTLVVPVINPDGLEIVVNWYRKNLGTPYETSGPPILYQKYVGHDNNRDWFMNNMPETSAATRVLYSEWYPQIIHNHHQTSPAWARIFLPPFRSPVNPRIHPGVTTGVNLVGSAMANRFAMEKMPGVISNVSFSMWWNGGMRTAPYYHNMVGILTETAHATPTPRFYDPKEKPRSIRGLATDGSEIFYPYPWEGGESHFRDAVDYMLTASMAVLDIAADRKEEFLYNIYQMGRDAIENTDEAFAYIIPGEQWDNGEAENLVNVLLKGGLEIHRAAEGFSAGEKDYEPGDFIAYGAQAFRPYLVDLMEKQDYPNQYAYPGGPPVPPYDLAGWTLPMQMGVKVDRVSTSFSVKSEEIAGLLTPSPGKVEGRGQFGFAFSCRENAAHKAVNLLQRRGFDVYVVKGAGPELEKGTFVAKGGNSLQAVIRELSDAHGIDFRGISGEPDAMLVKLTPIKIAIYKSWAPSMDEGWTRWVMEQHSFDLDTLHNDEIRSWDLSQYKAIILPSEGVSTIVHGRREGSVPEKYAGGIGLEGIMALSMYVVNGGTLISFDDACDFAIEHFGLPIRNTLANLSSNQFFIPGSLVRAKIDTDHRLGYGMQEEIAATFDHSKAFEIIEQSRTGEGGREEIAEAPKPEATIVATYASSDILMSGWALGADRYLKDKAALIDMKYGNGHVVMFGFRPQFRGQPRASYKMIFNAIQRASEE